MPGAVANVVTILASGYTSDLGISLFKAFE